MTSVFYTIDPNVSSTNSRVQSKHCYTSRNQYTILNYEKGFVCFDDTVSPIYRSVIMDANNNNICSFSPPKSITMPINYDKLCGDADILVNDIIEGSMVNLWYDRTAGCWEISTKSAVGGEYVYFRNDLSDGADTNELTDMPFIGQVTYKTMFLDAICEGTNNKIQDINDILILKEWDTQYCYSFVLQHPQNRIVLNIDRPRLYLIAVYRVSFPDQPNNKVEVIHPTIFRTWKWLEPCMWIHYPPSIQGMFEFVEKENPSLYSEERPEGVKMDIQPMSYTTLFKKYTSIHGSSNNVGVMITNLKTGARHKLVNTAYTERKEICRNNRGLFYQYLCLRYVKKLDDFLVKSPLYVPIFERFNAVVAQFVHNIYRSYQSRYMKRTGEIISHRYMPHAYNIHHTIYLPSISSTKAKITMQSVEKYLNGLSSTELYNAIYVV